MKFADIGSPGANLAMGRGEYQEEANTKGFPWFKVVGTEFATKKNGVVFLYTIRNTMPFRNTTGNTTGNTMWREAPANE